MSGKRVLALYAAVLLGFAVVLCRLYFLAENHTYAARAEAQSTVRLSLPARRGRFYDHSGLLLTGLETRYLALCFPGENNYTRLYAFTDSAGQALLYRNRNRSAPFLLEVDRDLSGRARDLWDMNEYFRVMNTTNESIQKALEILNSDEYQKKLKQGIQ